MMNTYSNGQKYVKKTTNAKISHIRFVYIGNHPSQDHVFEFELKPNVYVRHGQFDPNGRVYWKKDCSDKGSYFLHDLIKEPYEHESEYVFGYFEHYFTTLFTNEACGVREMNMDVLERTEVQLFSNKHGSPFHRFRLSDVDPTVCDETDYRTDFHYKKQKVEELLLFRNMYMIKNNNALHKACRKGSACTVHMLVLLGADVNTRNMEGETPLHMISALTCERCFAKKRCCSDMCFRTTNQSLEVAQTLLSLGANPDLEATSKRIPTDVTLSGKPSDYARASGKYQLFGLLKIAEQSL